MKRTRLFRFFLAGTLLLTASLHASVFTATLTGGQEVPPTGSPATGFIYLTLLGDSLTVNLTFSGLTGGNAGAAHIHCCVPVGTNAIVAVPFTGFPALASGSYAHTFDLTDLATYNGAFVTAHGGTAASAAAALIAGLDALQSYSNIHNATFSLGEIRGDLAASPEPSTAFTMLAGMLGIAVFAFRRNRGVR